METVAFYSYKGGVGRTLLVANTAQFLAMSGRRVVALDLDLEAPGLHYKLASPEVIKRAETGVLLGVVDALEEMLEGESRFFRMEDLAVEIDLPLGTKGRLSLIAAGSAPSPVYWTRLERLRTTSLGGRRQGGLLECLLELQAEIAAELAPDFLLVDSRTGITELGGLATSVMADRVVCLTTTSPESIGGTIVVAEALRKAPRLPSQGALSIHFLVARVSFEAQNLSHLTNLLQSTGASVAVLPQDSAIADRERVLASWEPTSPNRTEDKTAGTQLFSATLDWIARMFPGQQQAAESARRRIKAVHEAWDDLTRTSEWSQGGTRGREAWPPGQLRRQFLLKKAKKARQADIVAFDRPAEDSEAKPLLVLEYVEHEDPDSVAKWWLDELRVPVVAILSEDSDHRIYSLKSRWEGRARPTERWNLPLPFDFRALADPADVSLEALLESVRLGHGDYLDRLVTQWVRTSAAGLDGGAPWKPEVAQKIVDAFAGVENVELAQQILWAASASPHRRGMWFGDGDDWLEPFVREDLLAPLIWRLPPEVSIEFLGERHRSLGPTGTFSLGLMARDLLGLHYDPDATFRQLGDRLLRRPSPSGKSVEPDRGLYGLTSAFHQLRISFELSGEPPPMGWLSEAESKISPNSSKLGTVISELVASCNLVTTGLLGNYLAHQGKVILYQDAIAKCADKLALRARHLGSVVLIHETIHALTHLGRDLDGRMWPEFALPPSDNPLFEPSWIHEPLAQYFTYQHIKRLRDPLLLKAFETLSAKQAPAYRAWRRIAGVPMEEARGWLMKVRRGIGTPIFSSLLTMAAEDDQY